MKTKVLILAGGKGSRMGADVPKALVPICGKPIIDYILDSIQESGVDSRPAVVVGHDLTRLIEHVDDRADIVYQDEQHGTGHAVMVAEEQIEAVDTLLVTYGDHALFEADTYKAIVEKHESGDAAITMLTTELPDYDDWREVYTHFGRILRGADGHVEAIKEYKLCSEEEKGVKEVNNGMYCFDAKWLWENVHLMSNDNPKGEYLLTDMIAVALEQGRGVETISCAPEHGIGVNTPQEVAIAEKVLCNK